MREKRKPYEPYGPAFGAKHRKRSYDERPRPVTVQQTSPFFKLPAELRNAIYELVLVEEENILVMQDTIPPGLLSTNRFLRFETHKMWYYRNTFTFHIQDCDAQLMRRWLASVAPLEEATRKYTTSSILIEPEGRNWRNLVEWCRVVHGHGRGVEPRSETEHLLAVVVTTHRVARRERYRTWEECKEAVELLRPMAGVLHEDWLKD